MFTKFEFAVSKPVNVRRMYFAAILMLFVGLPPGVSAAENGSHSVDFNHDIRPLLSDNCFVCHGPDEKDRQANLRLDTKSGVFSSPSGYPVIVPGKPFESELYHRITAEDDAQRMPPVDSGKQLKPEQIALLTRWIEEGAVWQEHWAFVPLTQPEPPSVTKPEWVRSPLDQFILARLEKEKLQPTQEADKRALVRRATLDLTGLPPTKQEIQDFLDDTSPNAYERLVERLLAKPQYGEHMARYWLDLARYGDTHGLHLDNYREMWPYRDWVIQAFNANMPFDQFTTEQLAGDLLPNPTLDQRVATGFNRCNVSTSEGGSIDEEYYVRYAVDRTSTAATVWMGLTVGCAVCHDHKYDPIAQREFYQMYAFFNNITERAMDGNQKDPPPIIRLPNPEQAAQLSAYDGQIADKQAELKKPMPSIDAAQAEWEATLATWITLKPESFTSKGEATLTQQDDDSILASGTNPDTEIYEIVGTLPEGSYSAIRLEGLRDDSLPEKGAGRSSTSNVVLSEFEAEFAPIGQPEAWQPVRFIHAWADHEQSAEFVVTNALDGKAETGWAVEGHSKREDRQAIFLADRPFGASEGIILKVRVKHESPHKQHQFGRIRLAVTTAEMATPMGTLIPLSEWHTVGPFTAYSRDLAFLQRFEPEGKPVNLKQEFKHGEQTLKWTKQEAWAVESRYALEGENCATYAYRNLYSPTQQRVSFSVSGEDVAQLWLNQQLVYANGMQRVGASERELIQAELKPGNNTLMLKVVNATDEYSFSFDIEPPTPIVPAKVADWVAISPDKRAVEQLEAVRDYYRQTVSDAPEVKQVIGQQFVLRQKRTELENSLPTTLVMEERKEPRGAYVLNRGHYEQRLDEVFPGVPAVLSPMPEDAPKNRLGFARWLLDPNHPLTARVAVNRLWQQVFGVGLVKTSEDFGTQGLRPTHPALMDWLATEFIRSGWDVKQMMRLMVTSATYRQSAQVTPELRQRDPNNRLYARGPRFRLDAEALRDQALALSGLLHPKIGGPSVKPPQPDGLWYAVGYTSSNTARFIKDTGSDKVYRRSLYTFWKRTAAPPQMSILDAPSRESCTARRERTNTPMQALMLMNDPQYFEAARAFAERTIKEGGATPQERVAFAFESATARTPDDMESAVLLETYTAHLETFQADPEAAKAAIVVGESPPDTNLDPVELAAWTMITNLILNLDEVISKG